MHRRAVRSRTGADPALQDSTAATSATGRDLGFGHRRAGASAVATTRRQQAADGAGHETLAEIAVVAQRVAGARGCADRRRRPRWRSTVAAASAADARRRQHRHAVGDAEREAAAAPARRRDAAHRRCGVDREAAVERRRRGRARSSATRSANTPTPKRAARREVQRDVAAVVDVGAVDARIVEAPDQLLGDAAGHRGHRGDEATGGRMRPAGGDHAARDRAARRHRAPADGRGRRAAAAARRRARRARRRSAPTRARCAAATAPVRRRRRRCSRSARAGNASGRRRDAGASRRCIADAASALRSSRRLPSAAQRPRIAGGASDHAASRRAASTSSSRRTRLHVAAERAVVVEPHRELDRRDDRRRRHRAEAVAPASARRRPSP